MLIKNTRDIYNKNNIRQSLFEIDIVCTFWNESGNLTFRRFGISKYDQYSITKILSNDTEWKYRKLYITELIEDNCRRSTFNHSKSFHYYFALLMNSMNSLFLEVQPIRVEWIVMMEDLLKSFHSNLFNTFNYCW